MFIKDFHLPGISPGPTHNSNQSVADESPNEGVKTEIGTPAPASGAPISGMPSFGLSQFDKLLSETLESGVGATMPAPNSAVAHPPGASTGSSPGPTQNSNKFATESPCSIPNEGVKTEKASAPGKKKGKKIRRSLTQLKQRRGG